MQNITEKQSIPDLVGLVISYFGNSVAVLALDGQVFQCHLRRNRETPVVGDRVRFALEKDNTGVVTEIMPRRSVLERGDHKGKMKPIAANIDVVIVVMAPPPIFSEYLVDRYLIASELSGLPAALVLNKIDLLSDETRDDALNRLVPYHQISYPVILTSIYVNKGLNELAAFLQDKNAVLVGPSGVGKSSIIARLTNENIIPIGEVSGKGAGKHTTTATRLYHLPQGGNLIDSPGVREFNLWPVKKQDILHSFIEFRDFSGQCKFRDCQHLAEPDCAIKEAVKSGKINSSRYENYQIMMKKMG